ncbi:MAG: hypothetical protein ABTA16_04520 [Niallia sp.]
MARAPSRALQNLEHRDEKQFIFPNNKNTFYNNYKLNAWLKKFQTQHDLKLVSVHGLRDTCATRMYYQKKNLIFHSKFLRSHKLENNIYYVYSSHS